MIDFIGDIHGHADELEALLSKLGYARKNGIFAHPERKIMFVGDYIDRGPKIRETLETIRGMVDNGHATALMGNHEYNALCFHYQETEGGHLRKHLIKNIIQHYETLRQFQNRQSEYEGFLEWFKTLPLYFEGEHFRAVHACWDNENIDLLKSVLPGGCLTDDLIYQSAKKGSALYNAVDETLKGREMPMPDGLTFTDKDGHVRRQIRIKWWESPADTTYRAISMEPLDYLPERKIEDLEVDASRYYGHVEKPVFFGHYWLKGLPALFRGNICCLDYSVAKRGHLVAYRFDGESILDSSKLVWV